MNEEHLLKAIPIGISVLALTVSSVSLGWNIYRDVILKARLRVTFTASEIIGDGLPKPYETLVLSATNFGPGALHCSMIHLQMKPLWRRLLRKERFAVLNHDFNNPLSGKLPHKLEVGEKLDLLIGWDKDCFLREPWTHIGIADSFGRIHWAPTTDVKKARKAFREKYPA